MSFYIGIDGGASKTRGVLINENGETLSKIVINFGTNLKENESTAPNILIDLIIDLCTNHSISIDDISAFGFGIASVSHQNGRDILFKEFDRIGISDKSILINDAEAAYRLICEHDVGILVTIGTGVICIGKDTQGNFIRTSGKGHEKDIGSGYWIGNETFMKLALNESIIEHDKDFKQIYDLLIDKFKKNNLVEIIEHISKNKNIISMKASIAEDIISISESNSVARDIIHKATYNVAEEIIKLNDQLDYKSNDELILFCNGSVIKSDIYRKFLKDALMFDYPKINWIFSKLSSSYGSAITAALSKDQIKIKVKDILKGDYLVSG